MKYGSNENVLYWNEISRKRIDGEGREEKMFPLRKHEEVAKKEERKWKKK